MTDQACDDPSAVATINSPSPYTYIHMMFDAVAADGRREFMTAGQEGVVRLWDIANIGMCCKSIVAIYNPHKSTSTL